MIPKSVVEKINSREMTEDEFWVVALNFAKVVSEKARGMFKKKKKYDVLFYAILRVHKELKEILNLKVENILKL